ncbi:MAG: AraC family transcriptional regulator [Sphingomonadales bacterium]
MEALSAEARLEDHRTLDTDSVEESREELCRDICPHGLVATHGTPMHTLHSKVGLRSSSLHYVRYGTPVRVVNARLADAYLVLLPYGGEAVVRQGRSEVRVGGGSGAVIAPGSRFEVEGDAASATLIWRVDGEAVNGIAARWFEEGPACRSASALALDGGAGAGFIRTMRFVLQEMGHGDGLGANPVLRDRLEELLIFSLLGTEADGLAAEPRGGAAPVPACVRRVEAYIAGNAAEEVSLADLVAVSGVGARTLFRSFQVFRGRTPMAHLRHVRLQKVRADLLNAGADETVTSILSRWGITQFGRFAAEYKRTYGEPPSASLRIAHDDGPADRRW